MAYMEDGYILARKGAIGDLVALARDAAFALDQRPDSQEAALADALRGAAAQLATDLAEPVLI